MLSWAVHSSTETMSKLNRSFTWGSFMVGVPKRSVYLKKDCKGKF